MSATPTSMRCARPDTATRRSSRSSPSRWFSFSRTTSTTSTRRSSTSPLSPARRSDVPGSEIYERFLALHTREGGLVMPNAWDGLSAQLLTDSGFEAIGTSSVALAASLGRLAGRDDATAAERLAHAGPRPRLTGLPVNGDFEDGYGDAPEDVAATVL